MTPLPVTLPARTRRYRLLRSKYKLTSYLACRLCGSVKAFIAYLKLRGVDALTAHPELCDKKGRSCQLIERDGHRSRRELYQELTALGIPWQVAVRGRTYRNNAALKAEWLAADECGKAAIVARHIVRWKPRGNQNVREE